MHRIKIANRYIGDNKPCLIVAEIGINHNGELNLVKKMVDAAKRCGVDAVKFQNFKAEEFVSGPNETYTYQSQGRKITESMLEMFKRYEFSEAEWIEIFDYCKKKDVIFFSTPQDAPDLDFLLRVVNLPAIKVGSDDLTNLPLLKYYASKRLPIIISAGMAFAAEVEEAVNAIREAGNIDLIILHCISSYPAEAEEANLRKMLTIKQAFDVIVGFSDHTIGTVAATAAVVLGAKVVEKHFTLDKSLPGPDHWFSADPVELTQLVQAIKYAEKALGGCILEPTLKETKMRMIARRSIVAAKDIRKGELLTEEMLSVKRPGRGLTPKFIKDILNKKAKVNIKKNGLITFKKIC